MTGKKFWPLKPLSINKPLTPKAILQELAMD
jgi:hypothetical protein